jgi:hypothetical protein
MSIRIFGGKGMRKRPLAKPRCRCEDNIKFDFREVEFGDIF